MGLQMFEFISALMMKPKHMDWVDEDFCESQE